MLKSDLEISYVSDSVILELSWSLRTAACMEFLTGGLPKSDFEISYVSDSVVLELSWSLRTAACMEFSRVDCRSRSSRFLTCLILSFLSFLGVFG